MYKLLFSKDLEYSFILHSIFSILIIVCLILVKIEDLNKELFELESRWKELEEESINESPSKL